MGQQVALLQRCAQVAAEATTLLRSMQDRSDYSVELDALEIFELKEATDAFEPTRPLSAVRWGVAGSIVVAWIVPLPAPAGAATGAGRAAWCWRDDDARTLSHPTPPRW